MNTYKNRIAKYQQKVISWEEEISEWEDSEWEKELTKIKEIRSKEDIIKYYMDWRGWKGNESLMETLMYFLITL
jgi:hypothetical protein